jgi:hypothetical protein
MSYLVIIACWIAGIYLINKHFKKKKNTPTLAAKKHTREDKETVRITLAELSHIWEKGESNKKYSVKIGELSPLYKNKEEAKRPIIIVNFKHTRLQSFYDEYVKNNTGFTENSFIFIIDIMKLLDDKGNCPSVVKLSKLDHSKREFQLLSEISLIDHSIDVAEEIIKIYDSPLALPDAIAVALAHDIGKIPDFHGDFYSTGDHPELSARIIRNEIPSFKDLNETEQEEIKEAIILHHKAPKGDLGKKLIQADQAARIKEVQEAEDKAYLKNKKASDVQQSSNEAPQVKEEPAPAQSVKEDKNTKSVYDAVLKEEKKPYVEPETIDLSWFSVEEFIDRLLPEINLVKDEKFNAFSMSNGYIYFLTGLLQDTAVAMGVEAGNNYATAIKFTEDPDERKKLGQALINSVVNVLRQRNMIPEELCPKKYFGNYFNIKFKKQVAGKMEQRAFYTPLYSTVFVKEVSELEKNKPDAIKNIGTVEKIIFKKAE